LRPRGNDLSLLKRLCRPLCRWAPPSGTRPITSQAAMPPSVPMGSALGGTTSHLSSGYAVLCADGLRPRGNDLSLLKRLCRPAVPMGSALGDATYHFSSGYAALLCRWAPPSGNDF
ncbi:MAG: hypothetical protein WAV47_09630, partial [Blastocatellia bacterium]